MDVIAADVDTRLPDFERAVLGEQLGRVFPEAAVQVVAIGPLEVEHGLLILEPPRAANEIGAPVGRAGGIHLGYYCRGIDGSLDPAPVGIRERDDTHRCVPFARIGPRPVRWMGQVESHRRGVDVPGRARLRRRPPLVISSPRPRIGDQRLDLPMAVLLDVVEPIQRVSPGRGGAQAP